MELLFMGDPAPAARLAASHAPEIVEVLLALVSSGNGNAASVLALAFKNAGIEAQFAASMTNARLNVRIYTLFVVPPFPAPLPVPC